MDIEKAREYCLSKPFATEDLPFGPDYLTLRVCNKIFASIDFNRPHLIVVKCNPEYAIDLRDRYNGIVPAWHWNKRHWNEIHFSMDVSDSMVESLIDHSYEEVVKKLPRKLREGLGDFS